MSQQNAHEIIEHKTSNRKTDYLYRITLKSLIRNEKGEVLVVKETGRTSWDLPGGGIDHGENIKQALAREMKEEINLEGDFSYRIIDADEPDYLTLRDFWQVRLIFEVKPNNFTFSAGKDSDEIAFIHPNSFIDSSSEIEQCVYKYAHITATLEDYL